MASSLNKSQRMKVLTVILLGTISLIFVLLGIRASEQVNVNKADVQPELYDSVVKRNVKTQCYCFCKRTQRIGRFFIRRPTGTCYCDDLQHYSRAWCKCKGHGSYNIQYKDRCYCNCGYECHNKYRCTCKSGQPWCSCGVDIDQFRKKIAAHKLLCLPQAGYSTTLKPHLEIKPVTTQKPNNPYKGCDCKCEGRRYYRPPGNRYGKFMKMKVGNCQCPHLITKPVDWCLCNGYYMTGSSICHCKCKGEVCRTRFVCYCNRYNKNHCRCNGIRRYYRQGMVMKTSNGLCEPIHKENQGSTAAHAKSVIHKGTCNCICQGRRPAAGKTGFPRDVIMTTGNCQCGDLRHSNYAYCHCTGHGVIIRDTCFCNCARTSCNHQYKCTCSSAGKCKCYALSSYSQYYRVSNREIYCGRKEFIHPPPTKAPFLPCSCTCGGISKIVNYGHYKRIRHTNTGNCKCGDIAHYYGSSCRCWGMAFEYRSNCRCSCNGKVVNNRVNCHCWGIGRHICQCNKPKPKFKIVHVAKPAKNSQQTKQYGIAGNSRYILQKQKAICKNFPVYACSLNLGSFIYNRPCPGKFLHCIGTKLPIIANGKPAAYTFCDCSKAKGQSDYIKIAVERSCNHGLNKTCPIGESCTGGQLTVNFNNKQLALNYCVKPGIRLNLITVFGEPLSFAQHKYIYEHGHLPNQVVKGQKTQKGKPHVVGRKGLNRP